jgi:hypothetical protein
MSREDLYGQTIEIKEHPARVLTTERQGKILVAYGDSVVWSFEVEECQTWFVSQPILWARDNPGLRKILQTRQFLFTSRAFAC